MLALAIPVFFASVVVGVAIKGLLDLRDANLEITWGEFCKFTVPFALGVTVLVCFIGWKVAMGNVMTFNEYWNGWETAAIHNRIQCYKDGPCRWEYDCEPYRCNPHDCNCVCVSRDDKGSCTSELCQTCWDTCYHNCPYCTEEWTFIVKTTLGDYTIAEHYLPTDPALNRWTGTSDYEPRINQRTLNRAGVGVPEFWLGVLERTHNNTTPGGGVTKVMQYKNFILASEHTLLRTYSSDIERFLEAGLLPDMTVGVHHFYWADKVRFVGFTPENPGVWQRAVWDLNAALGMELQGDSHWVIVQNDEVSANPQAYLMALKAYWQTPSWKNEEGKLVKLWGNDCFAKNGVLVVIGTRDGKTVDWARLETGMPEGNEWLMAKINRRLKGTPLTPEAVVGTVVGEFYEKTYDDGRPPKTEVRGLHANGVVERFLWTLDDDPENPGFIRISMSGDDPEDVGTGYLFLKGEIQPTGGQKRAIFIGALLFSMIGWVVAAFKGERRQGPRDSYYYR